LFGRFFRASNAKGLPGTGIGLNLVLELVRLNRGEITAANAAGGGCVFEVRLPAAAATLESVA
jgi:signal transduction histidine kinase